MPAFRPSASGSRVRPLAALGYVRGARPSGPDTAPDSYTNAARS